MQVLLYVIVLYKQEAEQKSEVKIVHAFHKGQKMLYPNKYEWEEQVLVNVCQILGICFCL